MARCLDVNKFGLFPGQPGVIFSAVQGKGHSIQSGAVSRYRKSVSGELLVTTLTEYTETWLQPGCARAKSFNGSVTRD